MSSTVCQLGLQSCLETQVLEPRVLGLKLANASCGSDSESDTKEPDENKNINNSNGEIGVWSLIETLKKQANEEKERIYVHPLVKRSSSTLSDKSLELCTENLGCETGTDISENSNISSSSSDSESLKSMKRERSKLRENSERSKVNLHRSFPPPLTSINGSNSIYFRLHREGGRLVIKAVSTAPSHTCFQAERGDGCLKLRFVKDYKEEEEEEEEEEEDEEEEEEVTEERDDNLTEDIDGNNENDGGEMEIGKFQRPSRSRCKEGRPRNKEGLIWESCWLAT